jgi:hypothetical protein
MIAAVRRQEEAMADNTHVYVGVAGTVGMDDSGNPLAGIFRQSPGDKGWQHLKNGLPADAEVHAITVHPTDHDTIFVGSTKGIYRSTNRGDKFEKLSVAGGDPDTWSILVHPKDPNRRRSMSIAATMAATIGRSSPIPRCRTASLWPSHAG